MKYAPIARIILRYVVGGMVSVHAGDLLAGDPDVVSVTAMLVGVGVELAYTTAKRRGWST